MSSDQQARVNAPPAAEGEVIDHDGLVYRRWHEGDPVIALHPLALESSAFGGVSDLLSLRGMSTLGVDMPGFGMSVAGNEPLDAATLAAPIIELARDLERPPLLLGISLGARVALEAALTAPELFRGAVLVAPFLPWLEPPWFARAASHMPASFPEWAESVPLEVAWPVLHRLMTAMEGIEAIENDWVARASMRVAYYLSCPSTRRHLFSATRELLRDPIDGPESVWTRLPQLALPAAFLWADRDWLIPASHRGPVAAALPRVPQLSIPCSGHFANGSHFRCYEHAMDEAVAVVLEQEALAGTNVRQLGTRRQMVVPCRNERGSRRYRGEAGEDEDGSAESATSPLGIETMTEKHSAVRKLTAADSLFVLGETPTMHMHTMGTMILDPSPLPGGTMSTERIKEVMASRIHLMPPFRRRLVEVPFTLDRPVLADDPDFDPGNHFQSVTVSAPGTMQQLAEIVGDFASIPLDRSKPLWEMLVVQGLEDGKVALVTKLHHCMMDGASGASQMANFLDIEPGVPELPDPPPWHPEPLPSELGLVTEALWPRFPDVASLLGLVSDSITAPMARTKAAAEGVARGLPEASVSPEVPRTRFTKALSSERAAAFGSVKLDDLRFIKSAFGATVNDVILAACSLAVRNYLLAHDDLPEIPLVVNVPVSLKTEEEKQEFSNHVSLMSMRLPTLEDDPDAILCAIREESQAVKNLFAASDVDLLNGWVSMMPPLMLKATTQLMSNYGLADYVPSPGNLVVSNMPGPPIELYMAGAVVEAIYPMGPVGEGTGLNITVLSNMGRVDLGIMACSKAVPHPEELAVGFAEAVATLHAAAEARQSE
jgi:diacylglycerol O-acyltransferase